MSSFLPFGPSEHDDRCAAQRGYPCNCPLATFNQGVADAKAALATLGELRRRINPGLAKRWNWYLARRIGGRWWELPDRELRRLARQLSWRRSL